MISSVKESNVLISFHFVNKTPALHSDRLAKTHTQYKCYEILVLCLGVKSRQLSVCIINKFNLFSFEP